VGYVDSVVGQLLLQLSDPALEFLDFLLPAFPCIILIESLVNIKILTNFPREKPMRLVQLCLEILRLKPKLHDFLLVLRTITTLTVLDQRLIKRPDGILLFQRPTITRVILFIDLELIVELGLQIPSSEIRAKFTGFVIVRMRC
jgi:hypothetical protein